MSSATVEDGGAGGPDAKAERGAPAAPPQRPPAAHQRLDELAELLRHDPGAVADELNGWLPALDAADPAVAGRVHHVLGLALVHSDLLPDALARLETGRELLERAGARRELGALLRDLAGLRGNQLGQTVEALEGYEAALAIAAEVGSPIDEGCVLNGMGVVFGRMERWEDCERSLRRAVELLATSDPGTTHCAAVNNLSYMLVLRGRAAEAVDSLRAALAIVDPQRDPRTVLMLRSTLGLSLAQLGDTEAALAVCAADDVLLDVADLYTRATVLDTVGRIHLLAGDLDSARECLEQSLAMADAEHISALAVETVRNLAAVEERAGNLEAALRHERDMRRRERIMLDEAAAASLRRSELTQQVEISRRENLALEAARNELAVRVDERTAELRAEVEERRRAEERAAHLSRVDWLTGLPNRRHFEATMRDRLQATQQGVLALCFVDLDHFKGVNDRYGHLTGDELLQASAARLTRTAPPGAFVSRFGGDEFVVMATLPDDGAAERLAGDIVAAFSQPLEMDNRRMQLTCSVGLAVHPDDAGDAGTLLQRADNALLDAKQGGRSCWRRLAAARWQRVTYATEVLGELAGAVERAELSLAFQPQWRLGDGRCDGIEALLRWQHPRLGAVGPADFIPLAEDSGLICPIGLWVLEQACSSAAAIDALAHPALAERWSMCVNVSVRQLQDERFADDLLEIVHRAGWLPARLELEVTESMQFWQSNVATANLAAVRGAGVTVAIDDFGTGYASFGQLERLGVSRLKLDRSLIRLLDGPGARPALPLAMIALGHSLGIGVTAEGVETATQLRLLHAAGCDAVQGFAIGHPVAEHQLAAQLTTGRRRCAQSIQQPDGPPGQPPAAQ